MIVPFIIIPEVATQVAWTSKSGCVSIKQIQCKAKYLKPGALIHLYLELLGVMAAMFNLFSALAMVKKMKPKAYLFPN